MSRRGWCPGRPVFAGVHSVDTAQDGDRGDGAIDGVFHITHPEIGM
ncbi:hypothetical protein [Saccharothrix sp. NRRL B-16314]|nr:hypothetical protein [Saccharothrix sp. NRRL B-16314]